ncbi:MAG TPA: aminotransferase class I/II-fold pyridoxal phosphate-dependent enzyme [Thermoflexia bacterium]|jgi:cystathionine beta-lyase/cystathionine gamma-synthase|nr:aminotransferase class I/II-fold pyridoxal phosphate-dependent enzyme [Thermoflexia bacterium]
MHEEKPFFMRDPWVYDPQHRPTPRPDAHLGFDTRALHAGFHPLKDVERFRAFVPPIVQSMTYPYERFDRFPDYIYGRSKTPTVSILEERLASLEGGEAAVTASSGSQALFSLISTIARPGDNVVTSLNIFGEGYKQAATIFPERCNVTFRFVKDPTDPASWAEQIDGRTRLVWVETPSNPCLFITDIRAVAEVAHAHGVPLLVDNTIATAALQRPMELGADIVLLSITKFLSGNATVLGGAIVGPEALVEDIRWNTIEFTGAIMQPFEAWLTLQFLETLSLRMERHSANAQAVAEFLAQHPRVLHVNFPGLPDHPQHDLAQRQMKAPGGLLSFVVPGGIEGAARVMDNLHLIVHAVTFGTSRTICMHPATITHEHMTPEERAAAGIDDGLIRLSVGLEDPEDIIADLDQALSRL